MDDLRIRDVAQNFGNVGSLLAGDQSHFTRVEVRQTASEFFAMFVFQRDDFSASELASDRLDAGGEQRFALMFNRPASSSIEAEAAFRFDREADPAFPGGNSFVLAEEQCAEIFTGNDLVEHLWLRSRINGARTVLFE